MISLELFFDELREESDCSIEKTVIYVGLEGKESICEDIEHGSRLERKTFKERERGKEKDSTKTTVQTFTKDITAFLNGYIFQYAKSLPHDRETAKTH